MTGGPLRVMQGSTLALLVAIVSSLHPLPAPAATTFVDTNGRYLAVNGQRFHVHGANQYLLPFEPPAYVDEFLSGTRSLGLNVLRTWAFCNGAGRNGFCYQPQPGIYHEPSFRNLDYALYRAGQLGLRVVLPLVNNWDDFGGMNQYLAWCSSTAGHDDFYRNTCAKNLYKNYVQYVLTRVNTYTGIAYKDDPTIMLWELANEPRCESDVTGNTLLAWINEMGAFVKSIDPNHLVGTGEEGFYTDKGADWRHNGSKGVDFVRNSQSGFIDVASFHLYPSPYALDEASALQWLDEHVDDAHQVIGKPVMLGEFAWRVPRQVFGVFSTGTEGWRVDWGFTSTSPQRVESPSRDANGAILYSGSLQGGGAAAGEKQFVEPWVDVRPYQTIIAWVYLPPTAPGGIRAALYTKSGSQWTWREGSLTSLAPGSWTPVSIATTLVYDPASLRSIGVKIFNGPSTYSGGVYIDAVTASTSAPGQTIADRERIYGAWYQQLDTKDADAVLFWLLAGHQADTSLTPDFDHYSVYYPEDAGVSDAIAAYSAVIASKNAAQPPTDTPPSVAIQAPTNGATVSGSVAIQATASDDHGISGVTYAIDGGSAQAMMFTSGLWRATWDSTGVADGAHTIQVVATDTVGQQSPLQQVQVTVSNTPVTVPRLGVKSITLTLSRKGKNGIKKQAFATVAVVDERGNPVSGAVVATRWSGAATDTDTTTTDGTGLAKNIASNEASAATGFFQITVEQLTKSGYSYDPALNAETSEQVNF
jgi:mannan endo-1,4-beta-mannosidase